MKPIGIFDSGIGGLTVAREIRRLLPNESTIYVGDTARVPYGSKDPQTLLEYGRDIIRFLLSKNVKAVVLACGTSSANTFDKLKEEFPNILLIDVLRPGVAACLDIVKEKPTTRFGLIATAATIKSGFFQKNFNNAATLYSVACPLFASMVEAGMAVKPNNLILKFVAETYLMHLKGKMDALVLGCTHYPLLVDTLSDVLGDVKFINLADSTANALKDALILNGLLADGNATPVHEFYVSGSAEVFRLAACEIFNEECSPVGVKW